ncbi:BRD4-interacting chromatin-remodeling complex-associated protein-like [Garra rufa]|uniref:BRD4-interacting chromatin-remodeling complex-associated protein-like n=1 Tax=Garra rufa TaxID=137080 RepID=UPI003CCEF1EB
MLPSAGAALLHRPVQRWRGNPVDTALLFHDGVMDDEDDRRLLDFIGDVQALNEYLHGSNSKSIGEDDVTNAAFGSASSFFTSDTGGSNEDLKDDHNHLGEFGEAGGAELQLSSSLPFIEDDLDSETSQDGVDLGGEDQPFDILQKSLLEADITEQTLAQEALLDSQPSLIPTATAFPQQLVSGGFGGIAGSGVVAPLAQPQAFIQQVPQLPLPNGPAGHIQVVGSFNGSASSMMTINSLEQPQILLRQSGNVVTNNSGQGTMFAPSAPGQVSFNKGTIPVQNIIIQRGPMQQTLVRPIQPKPLQTGGQTVYNISNIGLQPSITTTANLVSSPYAASGSPQPAQQVKVVNPASSIVMHSPLGQQAQPQSQSNLPQGQFLLPTSISLTPGTTVHGFQAVNGQVLQTNTQMGNPSSMSTTTYSILTNQNTTVQLIAGQNFSTGGQLIVNQGLVAGGQIGQASPTPVVQVSQRPGPTAKVWTASASPSPTPVQTSQASGHLTMVSSGLQGPQVCQQLSVTPGQHLLMPVAQNVPATSGVQEFQVSLNQDTTTATQRGQTQLVNLLGTKAVKTLTPACQELPLTPKRPATQQLTRGEMVLQQLRRDHSGVMSSVRMPFTSFNDVIDRLLPYHVFQGSPPRDEDFTKVDEEFEAVATQVLNKTEAMVNKYRRLLMVEAERSSPSSEMVMIDRTFNQEERGNLTQDKRLVLVDPDGFLEEFCCGPKRKIRNIEVSKPATHEGNPSKMETSPRHSTSHSGRDVQDVNSHTEPAYRTEPQQQAMEEHRRTPIKCILDLKKRKCNNLISSNSQHAHYSTSPSQSQHSSTQGYPSNLGQAHEHQLPSDHSHASLADTDSVLEAAVNSILEC